MSFTHHPETRDQTIGCGRPVEAAPSRGDSLPFSSEAGPGRAAVHRIGAHASGSCTIRRTWGIHNWLLASLIAWSLVAHALPVRAESIEGVQFSPLVESGGVELELNSVGLLRYMVFIKAYVAGLYLGPGVEPEQILQDVPRRLEIEYFYAIDKEDFASSTIEAIRRNVGSEAFGQIEDSVQQFARLYRSVKPGDRYALTYLPGTGTELALNGEPLGVVAGAEFGSAVFAIWFGPQEIDEDLKDSLLKKRR